MTEALSDVLIDPLVYGVVHGDRAAWFQLTLHIEAWVEAHAPRHWRMRKARLANSPDDVRDVLLETLERLDRDNFAELRRYLDRKRQGVPDVRAERQSAELSFVAWLGALVDFAIREHVRRRYGRTARGGAQASEPSIRGVSKRSLHSWAIHPSGSDAGDLAGAAPGVSRILTAHTILSYAAEAFEAQELALLRRYLEQSTFEELAEEFALESPERARGEIRRLKERLRARFREAT
ncbi:MAG TPA: hypothetical protein VFZ61_27480 [Polyangiales bacterium]